ncbi:MAG: CYTH domain-containing protein, partial [Bacillales bacterium]
LLKSRGSALRVREKDGKFELTLKEPAGEGLLETTQILNKKEKETMLIGGTLPEGPVKEQLIKQQFPLEKLSCFGTLATERAEKPYRGGTVVLDYSSYLNKHDYEIEFETKDGKTGQKIFQELLQAENIPIRKTANKIRRFYEEKMRQARNKV